LPNKKAVRIDEYQLLKDFLFTEDEINDIIKEIYSMPIEEEDINFYLKIISLKLALIESESSFLSIAEHGL